MAVGPQPHQVHPAGNPAAAVVPTVPIDLIAPRCFVLPEQCIYFLALKVVDL